MTDPIIISSAKIKINSDGLYCLNDLHKASGGESKHKLSNFLSLDSTKSLLDELLKAGYPAVKKESGRYGGTYACKFVVYQYAMWVSPKFNIEVIDFFDRNNKVESKLNKLVDSVHELGEGVTKHLDAASLTFDDMDKHGSNWGSYGASIRKAKRECRKVIFELADKMQLKLEFK
jgi:hypothetical protein